MEDKRGATVSPVAGGGGTYFPLAEIDGVTKSFGYKVALSNITFANHDAPAGSQFRSKTWRPTVSP